MMTIKTDAYKWWQNALKGDFGPVHPSEPQCGYFRKRKFKNGPFEPVAIFYQNENLIALKGREQVDPLDIWTWVCKTPVAYDDYKQAVETGQWPDEPKPAGIGHNSNATTPFEQLQMELADDIEQAGHLLKTPVETQQQADIVAVLSKRLGMIAKKASDLHKVEKQPFLDGGRQVDEKWRDLKERPKAYSDKLKRHIDDFLRKKAAEEAERQRKAAEEAERLRQEAERKVAENTDQADIERLKREAALAEKQAKESNTSAGHTGAKVALRTFVSAKIVDYDKALFALKNHPEMKALVEQLANRAVRSGVTLEGVERVEEKRAA